MNQGWKALAAALLIGLAPGAARAQDNDGDTWSVEEGDCDDGNPKAHPGYSRDICGDKADNDCNGFYDDGCDLSVRQGSLRGGGGCTGNQQNPQPTGTIAGLGLLPLGLLRRRVSR